MDLEAEKAECKKLKEDLTKVKNLSAKIDRTVAAELVEPFSSKMKNFLIKADEETKNLERSVEESSSKFLDCLKFYSFTPKSGKIEETKPNEFLEELACVIFRVQFLGVLTESASREALWAIPAGSS